jgi:hypothetical protein
MVVFMVFSFRCILPGRANFEAVTPLNLLYVCCHGRLAQFIVYHRGFL